MFNPLAEIPGLKPGDECVWMYFCIGEGAQVFRPEGLHFIAVTS